MDGGEGEMVVRVAAPVQGARLLLSRIPASLATPSISDLRANRGRQPSPVHHQKPSNNLLVIISESVPKNSSDRFQSSHHCSHYYPFPQTYDQRPERWMESPQNTHTRTLREIEKHHNPLKFTSFFFSVTPISFQKFSHSRQLDMLL